MMLDFRPALAFVLIAFCIISLKLILILLFYLNFNRWLQIFSEIADHSKFIKSFNRNKLRKDGLEVLKVR